MSAALITACTVPVLLVSFGLLAFAPVIIFWRNPGQGTSAAEHERSVGLHRS